ncbi:MAG: hypothetical protein AAF799_13400 [Myxococcota bacterium]
MSDDPHQTIEELIRSLFPGFSPHVCPSWPPDLFAITASLLAASGAYLRSIEVCQLDLPDDEVTVAEGEAPPMISWPKYAARVGNGWHLDLCDRAESAPIIKLETFDDCLPAAVEARWQTLMKHRTLAVKKVLPVSEGDPEVADCLVQLCAIADQASAGFGIGGYFHDGRHVHDGRGLVALEDEELGDLQKFVIALLVGVHRPEGEAHSLCGAVPTDRVVVLPKQHIPQRGLTLRSLSHNLALCRSREIATLWTPQPPGGAGPLFADRTVMNLLLLPWPLTLHPTDFRTLDKESVGLPERFRYFEFDRKGPLAGLTEEEDFRIALEQSIEEARSACGKLDGVVFPELALSAGEFDLAFEVAREKKLLLISGVHGYNEKDPLATQNAAAINFGCAPNFFQNKRHRWCLDRSQILAYGLGGRLPSTKDCWEYNDFKSRRLTFFSPSPSLTFCVLICEDLARQDDVTEIVRAVGPHLVFALLMDGPQLRSRWSARYASVLSDDPGSSVLTLTSLGMSRLTRGNVETERDMSGVIALWHDVHFGERELAIGDDAVGGVLSLSIKHGPEWSSDGRSDDGYASFPVFGGFQSISKAAVARRITKAELEG